MDLLNYFNDEVYSYLLKSKDSKHVWINYLSEFCDKSCINYQNILFYGSEQNDEIKAIETFKNASSVWTFKIVEVIIKNNSCFFNIERSSCITKTVREIFMNSNFGMSEKFNDESVNVECKYAEDESSLLSYRKKLIGDVMRNLICYSKYAYTNEPSNAKYQVIVTTVANLKNLEASTRQKFVLCAAILDPKTKKKIQTSLTEYLSKRSQDMHLISIHKYGIRVKTDDAFKELIERLGKNATNLDILEVKHSSALILTSNSKQEFILYNSARLERIMESFNKKVDEKYYEKLPHLNNIDLSVLNEEEEWKLIKIMLLFPDTINRSINDLSKDLFKFIFRKCSDCLRLS
ncbi:CLUMA_CG011481, isoform A [Clunio marinus]|uniref:CLUMA_CG011481, isoform A n=1 Tax=Clunio marinus TaxID=568069 RepID=A0A1J1II35_9DIPT|nr:CLUMA_CG011481, isoform A [Clunio marinus]